MSRIIIKKVRTRRPHECEACTNVIPARSLAFLVLKYVKYSKYPRRSYYHADEQTTVEEFRRTPPNEIRRRICSEYWG